MNLSTEAPSYTAGGLDSLHIMTGYKVNILVLNSFTRRYLLPLVKEHRPKK